MAARTRPARAGVLVSIPARGSVAERDRSVLAARALALALLAAACSSSGAKPPDGGGDARIDLSTDAGACNPVTPPDSDGGVGGMRRYFPPTRFMLGPLYGTGCPVWGECESGGTMTDEVNYHLDKLTTHDIPITMYHFDGQGWSATETCDWTLGDALTARLAASGLRALLHFWGGCYSVADFDHVYGQLGYTLGGFYLDEASTDAFAKSAIDWAQGKLPGDSEIVMKGYQGDLGETDAGLGMYGHSCYVNDLDADFAGLKEGVRRVLSLANELPAPFNEFTGYDVNRPDEETFYRRIHFGAMQVVMDHSPLQNTSPWNSTLYSKELLDDYRTFAWLHKELVPYLHSYDWNAFETGQPIFRGADMEAFTTKIGEEIFVAYVTDPVATKPELDIKLPPGEWIDYWDARAVVSGTLRRAVPLGHEPIFIANGAIIPMDVSRDYTGHGTASSAGSLTVLVYPKGDTSFRYRDDAANRWIVFGAHQTGDRLELSASKRSVAADPLPGRASDDAAHVRVNLRRVCSPCRWKLRSTTRSSLRPRLLFRDRSGLTFTGSFFGSRDPWEYPAFSSVLRRPSALAILLTGISACSSSVLIRPDDRTFERAERHLVATNAYVQGTKAPPAEAALVLQAESLYRYRFDPPTRGFTSYAAEFAASAIEIPAIQSMSGALDIFDLRLKMSDGAVQLWETYLSRYPNGALRPLVLYRLGWAYHSTGAAGLPRKSGNEAFEQLRREYPSSPLSAIAADIHGIGWKSKDVATGWSVIPGLGQMYVGSYRRGSIHLLMALAAATMMVAPLAVAYERRHDLTWGRDWPLLAVGVGGLFILSLDYTVAYQDAIQRVVEWNDHVESAFEDAHPEAP